MKCENKMTIQRMLGKIEGVAFVLEDKYASPLFDAIECIDEILEREEGAE